MSERTPLPPPPPPGADVLTIEEVAGLLRVRLSKARRLRRSDSFPEPRPIGGDLRWLRAEVLAWFESQSKGWSGQGGPRQLANLRRGRKPAAAPADPEVRHGR